MTIIQDTHEPLSIKYELEQLGLKIERKHLDIGDYAWNGYRIERKTVGDFMGSIYSRRLFNQLYNLMQADHPILIVIGEIPPRYQWIRLGNRRFTKDLTYEEQMKKYKIIRKNMLLAYSSFNVQFIHALDERDFYQIIMELYYNTFKKGTKLRPLKRKSQSPENARIDMLGCVPNIGKHTADRLSKEYTIRELFSMSKKKLMKIDGIGKVTADKMLEIVSNKTEKEE